MSWNLMLVIFHAMLAMGAAHIFCRAPDRIQKLALFLVIAGFLILYGHYAAATFGPGSHWIIKEIALYLFYFAVLIHVLRLIFKDLGICPISLPPSSATQG